MRCVTFPVRSLQSAVLVVLVAFATAVSAAGETAAERRDDTTIEVTVKLRSGGQLTGAVVDHDEHGLVLLNGNTPYVFAYTELTPGSAYVTQRDLLAFERGGEDRLTAADHFALGTFALSVERNDLAALEFRKAGKLDERFAQPARQAFAEFRERRRQAGGGGAPFEQPAPDEKNDNEGQDRAARNATDRLTGALSKPTAESVAEHRARVMEVYRTFGEKVREVIGRDIALVETKHFLIWTDWAPKYRDRLADWCEAMYAALCRQFDLDPEELIFIAKCPVFCFRSKPRFQKFAQYFDGYSGKNAVGYTRSIEANGHVHVVLLRQGGLEADFDRFACTLVHEGTHAFVHRLSGPRLIPHWVNEGLAELISDRVLGDWCPSARNAEMLARWYVRNDRPVGGLLRSKDPIGVEQYAIAHSLIGYLETLGPDRFRGFIHSLKAGAATEAALRENYDGMSLEALERAWREHVRSEAVAATADLKPDARPVERAPEPIGP